METQDKIMNTQNKAISLDAIDLNFIKADDMMPKGDKEYVSKEEMMGILGQVVGMVRQVMDRCMERDDRIVSSVNDWCDEHVEGHLPGLDAGQKMKIFRAAGMEEEVEVEKTPIECESHSIWATELPKDQVEKLNAIKISVR